MRYFNRRAEGYQRYTYQVPTKTCSKLVSTLGNKSESLFGSRMTAGISSRELARRCAIH